jgi:ketosteroid isomerase-like protein
MDIEEFARRLREAYAAGMEEGLAAPAAYVAEEVELAHEPVHAADGLKSGAELAAMWSQEGSMLRASMPDVALTDLDISTRGEEEVVLQAVMRGTNPDGSTLEHPYTVVYTFRGGQVVRAWAGYDPAPVAALNQRAFRGPQEPGGH